MKHFKLRLFIYGFKKSIGREKLLPARAGRYIGEQTEL
jgi:hypothetical protein